MCGIAGVFNQKRNNVTLIDVLKAMSLKIVHRGPDDFNTYTNESISFAFRRLSIIDITNGQQPFFGCDRQIVMVCNGEIYNYRELKEGLIRKGYVFKTNCDIEVIIPLYLEYGDEFITLLNGQFAIALFDGRFQKFLLIRDHLGICPLFYTQCGDDIIFGSEVKAILENNKVERKVNLSGLDMTFNFPGLVSPTTMFDGINSVKPGHYIRVENGRLQDVEYWDLIFPTEVDEVRSGTDEDYFMELEDILLRSIKYRMQADVPVGFYLSGGLDSSLIGGLMKKVGGGNPLKAFSIGFPNVDNAQFDEMPYQDLIASTLGIELNRVQFNPSYIIENLERAIYHSECPLKESYNTCSLALSQAVRSAGHKVILSGEGADELFGGYIGYRFDNQSIKRSGRVDLLSMHESQLREEMWGDPDLFYEKNYIEFQDIVKSIYSDRVLDKFSEFDCTKHLQIQKKRLAERHVFHKRSYLDQKLRLSDHLLADHCDRTTYANSVEGRYPFLDINLVNFVCQAPRDLKLRGNQEKYLLREVARKYVPERVRSRQKFGFIAPGTPDLLGVASGRINDLLSYDRIKRQGYFNPDSVERLKMTYRRSGFKLNLPYDDDLLMIILTFNIFLDLFRLPDY